MSKEESGKEVDTIEVDVPVVISKLAPFQQSFVMHYVKTGDSTEAYILARKDHSMPRPSKELANKNSMVLLMDKGIKDSIHEYRNSYKDIMTTIYSNSGVDIAKIFSDLATDTKQLERIDKRIARFDELIEEAVAEDKMGLEISLMKEQLNFTRQREKYAESARKNASVINDIIGDSKQKQIVKADSITINMGNQTIVEGSKTSEHLEAINAEVVEVEETLPDIEELGGLSG